jgi:hypothetical protein
MEHARGGGRGRGRGGAGVRESGRAPVSGPAAVCTFWRQGVPSDQDEVSPSDVLVNGRGEREEVLEVLHDIADTCRRATEAPTDGGRNPERKVESRNEFKRLAGLLEVGQAQVVLRKLFLYKNSACRVMHEIWIKDKQNPDATMPGLFP